MLRNKTCKGVRHPRRVLFCWTELSFPLDTEEKYVSAEIKGACGET